MSDGLSISSAKIRQSYDLCNLYTSTPQSTLSSHLRSAHLVQGASPKSIRLRPAPYEAPFLRWTQHTSPSGAMEQQRIHIACSNHYWSEHKALLLHTPTNSATQGEPILLRPSTTSATHHATIQISPPSFGEGSTRFSRAYIIYVSCHGGQERQIKRAEPHGKGIPIKHQST